MCVCILCTAKNSEFFSDQNRMSSTAVCIWLTVTMSTNARLDIDTSQNKRTTERTNEKSSKNNNRRYRQWSKRHWWLNKKNNNSNLNGEKNCTHNSGGNYDRFAVTCFIVTPSKQRRWKYRRENKERCSIALFDCSLIGGSDVFFLYDSFCKSILIDNIFSLLKPRKENYEIKRNNRFVRQRLPLKNVCYSMKYSRNDDLYACDGRYLGEIPQFLFLMSSFSH